MSQKVIYVFKSEYLFVDKICTKCSTRIDSPVQLFVFRCVQGERPQITVGEEKMRLVINLDAVVNRKMLNIHGIELRILHLPALVLTELFKTRTVPFLTFFIIH